MTAEGTHVKVKKCRGLLSVVSAISSELNYFYIIFIQSYIIHCHTALSQCLYKMIKFGVKVQFLAKSAI